MTAEAALLTPPGMGAIAVIGLRGPEAWAILRELLHPPPSRVPKLGSLRFARFGLGTTDEVVLLTRRLEPAAEFEIHCHGGKLLTSALMGMLRERGATVRSATAYAGVSSVHTALQQALTKKTAAILLDQVHGAFASAVQAIRAADPAEAARLHAELRSWCPLGRHLTRPWRVVLAGPPNAGKSSLLNALAGRQRAVVSPIPGTTRDVVTALHTIHGWPIELIDTAGLRATQDSLEQAGIERTHSALADADMILWLIDGSEPAPIEPPSDTVCQAIITKCDRPPAWEWDRISARRVSAHTGAGMAELAAFISKTLVPREPAPGTPIPPTPEWAAAIEAGFPMKSVPIPDDEHGE